MMIEERLDEDGYPTDEALNYIETFDWQKGDVHELFAFIRSIWTSWGYWVESGYWLESFVEDSKFEGRNYMRYEFSTAGWSGNEEIIDSLKKNGSLYDLCLESYRRGGHYVFDTRYVINQLEKKLRGSSNE